MRTTRTSTGSDRDRTFRSRFEVAEDMFPLRQSQRARDELARRVITAIILVGLTVSLPLFGRSVHRLVDRHGDGGVGWLVPLVWGAIIVAVLLALRRIYGHLREIQILRDDLKNYRTEIDRIRDQA